ncbi:MAG: hypothetical protein IJP48_00880 [Synergistaceae bacterium]|nr:hypothetical protein [Synergistaceae bacterium]
MNGELTLAKKGLITIRGGDKIDDVDVFATTFGKDTSLSTRTIFHNSNASRQFSWSAQEPHYLRPAVSRRLYNGKRALMYHNLAPNGEAKYYFKTLSNNRTSHTTGTTPSELVNSVQISDFGEYTLPAFSNVHSGFVVQVFGTGVMEVKGYDREIFVAASGPNNPSQLDKAIRLEFFALNADSEGKMTQEPLTALTNETPFRGDMKIVSLAVGDFDGDKHNNEAALMINTRNDIYIFVYRLIFSNGKLELKSLGDPSGIHVFATDQWGNDLESQPVTDMVAGDFDGDGTSEIALLFKIPVRAPSLANEKGWPNGPMTGAIHCKIHKWNAEKRDFDTTETAKAYNKEELINGTFDLNPCAKVAGVAGLRAAAADLDGDGKDEIVTLLLGYFHRKVWNAEGQFPSREDEFCAYPHLTVWKFDNSSDSKNPLTPVHDDAHVKGGGESSKYNYGPLYDLAQDKDKRLLMDQPHLDRFCFWTDVPALEHLNKNEGINPEGITHMYALTDFSIAAGAFTGTLGTFKTVDDIAVAWKKPGGIDCVTIFKTKVTADDKGNKIFDGFEDGKIAIQDTKSGGTWRGLIAADFASEGVELGTPVHIRKKSNRSYIAALSAIPYHVDTVDENGTALTEQPVNFTYSDASNGGNMTVEYGKTTTDSTTNTVKQDLSQSVETMFAADPTGTDEKVQGTFATVKGLVGFASAIGGIAHGIKIDNMTTEEKKNMVWKPDSPTEGLTDLMDFFTDRVDRINENTNGDTSTTTIDKNVTATTHDAILFTNTARHIWRYPVLTRPLPTWLAFGPRIDSTQIEDPGTVKGDKELFITFTMSENSALNTSTSVADSVYQPLHEEGNFFSYPPHVADVEGYNEAGLLAGENTWTFGSASDISGITFTKAASNMQHTETKVTPSGFTSTVCFFDRLFNGDKATGIKMPDSDNPKTFSKEYNKTEKISYSLMGSSNLTSMQAANYTVKMQPFVAKEGAMTFATAVELTNNAKLWRSSSLYQQKSDPALYLPLKFVKDGSTFRANTDDETAMKIRGIKFYAPDFAFLTDNRLANGQNYEIRVPLYNASFKDTGNFTVKLSWIDNINNLSSITENDKHKIGEVTVTLGGWNNDKNNNKGWAVFNWTPNLTSSTTTKKAYYLYVEVDSGNNIDEVHEARYSSGRINDYGGNNTGFYPFYVYNVGDPEVSISANASDAVSLTPLYFTDADGSRINDMAAFILEHKDESFVPITANFNYNGPETPYSFFVGYILTQSGKQKIPGASINTIVNLDDLSFEDVEDVFMLQDIALFNGNNQVKFTISPAELIKDAENITAKADLITFGIKNITEDEILSSDEEFYEGEDPNFELEEIPDNIVSTSATKTYTLRANENVFWIISSVKKDSALTSDADNAASDDRDYLDITLQTVSEDEFTPSNYGKEAIVTVSSIAGLTPKGDFEITVKKSADGDEWEEAEVLTFDSANSEGISGNNIMTSSSGGCNTGLGLITFALLLSSFKAFRKKR